jgi:hypothetical protein
MFPYTFCLPYIFIKIVILGSNFKAIFCLQHLCLVRLANLYAYKYSAPLISPSASHESKFN